jgi:DNA gyrase subunit A
MVTRKGIIKRSSLAAFGNPRSIGIIAIHLDIGDALVAVKRSEGQGTVLLATREGRAIHFQEEEVRSIGRSGRGVMSVILEEEDRVVSAELPGEDSVLLTVCEKGYGKRTKISEYSVQRRRGKGLINIRITEKNGKVVVAQEVQEEGELILITSEGKSIRLKVKEIPVIGRITQGVRLIDLADGDKVVATTLAESNHDDRNEEPELLEEVNTPSDERP